MTLPTKYDMNCLHFGHNLYSFQARWIEANLCINHMGKEWDPSHPVVADVASRGKCSLDSLKNRWSQQEMKKVELITRKKIVNNYKDLHSEFVDQWNNEIDRINSKENSKVKIIPKAFYIWVEPGAYKTSFIKWILGHSFDAKQVYTVLFGPDITTQRQAYASFNEKLHSLALLDEFDFEFYEIPKWKLALEGQAFQQEIKYGPPVEKVMDKVVFMHLSNLDPSFVKKILKELLLIPC